MRAIAALVAALAAGCACPSVPPDRAWPRPAVVVTRAPPIPAGAVRFAVGGDSRRAFAGADPGRPVLRWAFETAGSAGASAFFYLGDMERTPPADAYFRSDLAALSPRVAFCPVYGNHEALWLGALDLLPEAGAALDFVRDHLAGCLGLAGLPAVAARARAGRVYYAVDLPGDVHFVALDDVASGGGLGEAQIRWLSRDLDAARARGRRIVVGMHKALAGNGVTPHSMDEDAPGDDPRRMERESDEVIRILRDHGVELILASHEHGYWELGQGGIRSFITGGLGAPLRTCAGPDHAFFHLLLVDVTPGRAMEVTPVRWDPPPGGGRR